MLWSVFPCLGPTGWSFVFCQYNVALGLYGNVIKKDEVTCESLFEYVSPLKIKSCFGQYFHPEFHIRQQLAGTNRISGRI